MIDERKQELLEQYDDAAFALLMDEYAEKEGELLLKEFEEAMASGDVPEIPKALDQKCRQLIHQNFIKQHRKNSARKALRLTGKAAAFVLAFLGLSLATILSVEALRVPFLNYFVRDSDRSSVISFTDNTNPMQDVLEADPLAGLLPNNYFQVEFRNNNGLIYSVYTDDLGNYAIFDMTVTNGEYFFDSEEAVYTHTQLLGFDAIYRCEDDLQMIWLDEKNQIAYSFTTSELTESSFLEICNWLASRYE